MAEVKFDIKCPMFVARQILRHRTASVNELSARYSEMKDEFYHPYSEEVNMQSSANKMGSSEAVSEDLASEFIGSLKESEARVFEKYKHFLEQGIARETARMGLPVNLYTRFYFKIDLRNLFNFLHLRMDSHAQSLTREYANAMFQLIIPIFPVSCQAFIDYQFNSVRLTRLEAHAIRNNCEILDTRNKRENEEWKQKQALLMPDPTPLIQAHASLIPTKHAAII